VLLGSRFALVAPKAGCALLGRRRGAGGRLLALVVASSLLGVPAAEASSRSPVELRVLSNRADLISGGDALVEVLAADPSGLSVGVDGRDVSGAFARRASGRVLGLVDGLTLGDNVLTARLPGGAGARITITNHPTGGPVFAGEQVQPWPCATEPNGLGPALDAQCNAKPVFDFFYMSSQSGAFEPYDPGDPPPASDITTTTTDEGHTVPYIVRRERGVIDRGIYDVAVLFDPAAPWTPFEPQRAWNGKLLWPFGGSCQPYHGQVAPGKRPDGDAQAAGVLNDTALSRGFMVASSGFSTLANNCNTVVAAEAMMMVKEHLVESYGRVRYTFGIGNSGGSIQQISIAGSHPGLLDGITPDSTFADLLTTGNEVLDCRLLVHYFNVTSPHLGWTPLQKQAVEGHGSSSTCEAWVSVYGFAAMMADPTLGCRTPLLTYLEHDLTGTLRSQREPDWVYHPDTNRAGVRCTVYDYMKPVFGRRPSDGFARRPYDNVGVQYGLEALRAGLIVPEQFVDLNEKIGGLDIDYGIQPERTVADGGSLEAAYRSGAVTQGRQLAKVPIIDGSSAVPAGEIHTAVHAWSLRERLRASNGHGDNHVIRQSLPRSRPAFDLMDDWLSRIEADAAPGTLEERIVRNKPADAVDSGSYLGTNPRIASGAPLRDDILKCRLKPLARADYAALTIPFTDDQWTRLNSVYPDGVCDWTQAGVAQQETIPWATYAGGFGPVPLGPPPASEAFSATPLER
jgi:hypothetical protein